jgi:protein-disulfide isomerase
VSSFRASALVLLLAAACAKPDASKSAKADSTKKPEAAKTVAAAGDVASAGMTPGLTDSVSTRADKGRIRGSENATVWVVEISDFQCPYCKMWHDETFATIDKEYVQTGKVRLAYLNYPIASIHPNATAAAEAAMCAAVQGKFWQMHDALFKEQASWAKEKDPMAVFATFAVDAGVDPKNWHACMASHATKPIIDADRQRSGAAGVQSTPSFFVGSRMILGAQPVDSFRVAINAELAKAATPAR